jgi:serine/threonine-protein kinase
MDLPGYEILEKIGQGGMGVVYKARQVRLNRLVAVKMMLAGAHAGPEERVRFCIEAQAAARLDHPHIVRIHDFGEHQGHSYFSMELVSGGSLARKMAGPPWPAAVAARLVQTLARAIHHAHQQNIVHRDLKPGNVLFHHEGTPKITDFGLAKQLDRHVDLTAPGQVLGSPRYMAPEQAAGDVGAIGPATDVHALGVILYELLTGRSAFGANGWSAALEQVRTWEPIPPRLVRPELPAELDAVCLRCLRKDPVRRFGTAAELAEALDPLLTETPGPAPRPPSLPAGPGGGEADRDQWWRV